MTVKKKRIIVISALVLCLIGAGIVGGISLTSDSNAKVAEEETVTIVDKETGEKEVVEADSEEAKAAAKDPEMKVVANDNNKVSKSENKSATKATTKSTTKSDSKNAKQMTYEADKKASSNSSNSSSKNSPSTNNSSSKNNTTQATQHTHNWVAVTGTRQVPYQDVEYYYTTVCSACGAEGVDAYHLREHAMRDEDASYKEMERSRTVTKYRTETYTKYYQCACGATK